MLDHKQNLLNQMMLHIERELYSVLKTATVFYQLRVCVRDVATQYPDFIIWSPHLIGTTAVVDIWDKSHTAIGQIVVPVPKEWTYAPMW